MVTPRRPRLLRVNHSGEQHSVRDFVQAAAEELGMALDWLGEGVEEKGIERKSGRTIVAVDPRYFRPAEVETLLGDATMAREKLGWRPRTSFRELVAEMVAADLREAERDHLCRREGFPVLRNRE